MAWTVANNVASFTERGVWKHTLQGTLGAAADPSPNLDAHDFPFWGLTIKLVSGTAPTGFQVKVSNDGGATFSILGAALGAAPINQTNGAGIFDLLQVVPTGGDATTVLRLDLVAYSARG